MWNRFQVFLSDRLRWSGLMLVVLVLGAGWTWASSVPASGTTAGRVPSPREGFSAPDFTLDLLQGGQVTLSELRGKVVVVNLWATWCPPCRAEMPAFQEVYEEGRDRGLVILAVNTTYQDSLAEVANFVGEYGLTFPVALDRDGNVASLYQLRALPSTFFVDREGVIQEVVIGGPISPSTIKSTVEALLGEGE